MDKQIKKQLGIVDAAFQARNVMTYYPAMKELRRLLECGT